jgi:hypothetical protein
MFSHSLNTKDVSNANMEMEIAVASWSHYFNKTTKCVSTVAFSRKFETSCRGIVLFSGIPYTTARLACAFDVSQNQSL